MLLKDEYLPLTISLKDESRRIRANLALAAIDVSIPKEISKRSRIRPICLADAIAMGTRKGEITIKALGWRRNRVIFAKAGNHMLFVKELKQPTATSLNPLVKKSMFVPASSPPRNLDLILSIGYGKTRSSVEPATSIAWADMRLLQLEEGIGFKSFKLVSINGNLHCFFDKPVLCNTEVSFRKEGRRPKELPEESLQIFKDTNNFELPARIAYLIHTKKHVVATFTPRGRMGKPIAEYSFDIPLKG